MKSQPINSIDSVVLVSTPWPLYSRPSIQIATLKAFLRSQFPDLRVKTHHFYLKVAEAIEYKIYHEISERTWLAETIYAALLYPERSAAIEKLFFREAKGKPLLYKIDFESLTRRVREVTDTFIEETDWSIFGLAGFSICLCQLTSTLYCIKRIKSKYPNLPVVVGGSMFTGDSTRNLLEAFPEIDYVAHGEGELPLSNLVKYLKRSPNRQGILPHTGIITLRSVKNNFSVTFNQLKNLSQLPIPDYKDYFDLLETFSSSNTFFPTLPAEISRGCWWENSPSGKQHSGCAFCNLNLQWDGYRSKEPEHVVAEVDQLTTQYKTLSVAFMDNLIPLKRSGKIFNKLAQLNKDFHLFCEIRATTPRRILENMKRAGVQEIQIGIEALSTRLLKKLNKGTSAIQNLEIMKNCEELGLANSSNLIMQFPGSDLQDVEETLQNLEFALAFRPMKLVHFWLGIGSPVWRNPQAFGLKAVFNHPNWAIFFPKHVFNTIDFMIQAYRGDLLHQKDLWKPVKQKVKAWQKAYTDIHREAFFTPILSFRDGRDFLIIRQRRWQAEPMTHRLVGTSRSIYLFCQHHRSIKRILHQFPGLTEDQVLPFLKMMVGKKLMFEEDNNYLSLAVPVNRRNL